VTKEREATHLFVQQSRITVRASPLFASVPCREVAAFGSDRLRLPLGVGTDGSSNVCLLLAQKYGVEDCPVGSFGGESRL
jgi:hypothetical protein